VCDCDNKNIDLQTIKIYLLMYEYKKTVKGEGTTGIVLVGKKDFDFRVEDISQEMLAYGYEELGLTEYIEKTTKNEQKTTGSKKKKSSKKSVSTKD
jgi:3-isopropylmalate dehydratase small subunit